MLTKLNLNRSKISQLYINVNMFKNFRKCFSTIEIDTEEKINSLNKFVLQYNTKKLEKSNDFIILSNEILGKPLKTGKGYKVFESKLGKKIYKNIFSFLFFLIPSLIYLYFSLKWANNKWKEYKLELCTKTSLGLKFLNIIFSLFLIKVVLKNSIYKIWLNIKYIELSNDLKKLKFKTFFNQTIETETNNVYLYSQKRSYYYSIKNNNIVYDHLMIGIKSKYYFIPLEICEVNKDLLGIGVIGYKLKKK